MRSKLNCSVRSFLKALKCESIIYLREISKGASWNLVKDRSQHVSHLPSSYLAPNREIRLRCTLLGPNYTWLRGPWAHPSLLRHVYFICTLLNEFSFSRPSRISLLFSQRPKHSFLKRVCLNAIMASQEPEVRPWGHLLTRECACARGCTCCRTPLQHECNRA